MVLAFGIIISRPAHDNLAQQGRYSEIITQEIPSPKRVPSRTRVAELTPNALLGITCDGPLGLVGALGVESKGPWPQSSPQRAQYPLIKEYSLNHNIKPYMI